MSEGIRSGVNWTRANFHLKAEARALTMRVLARPGTPTRRAWEPVRAQVRRRSIVWSCPTTTWWRDWRIERTRSTKEATRSWATAAVGSAWRVMTEFPLKRVTEAFAKAPRRFPPGRTD